jgi:hypothetical protein
VVCCDDAAFPIAPGTRQQSLTLFVAAGRRSPCRAAAPLARVTNARVGASSCLVFRARAVQRAYHGIDERLVRCRAWIDDRRTCQKMWPRGGRCHEPACRRAYLHRHLAIRITRDGELVVRDCREDSRAELTRAETGYSSAELIHYGQVRTSPGNTVQNRHDPRLTPVTYGGIGPLAPPARRRCAPFRPGRIILVVDCTFACWAPIAPIGRQTRKPCLLSVSRWQGDLSKWRRGCGV